MFDWKNSTSQKIFDYVSEHLIKQGRAARGQRGNCMYRTLNGLSCAIGLILPDEFYNQNLEGCVASELPGRISDNKFSNFIQNNLPLFQELQNAHDSFFETVDQLKLQLEKVAIIFDLNTEVLKETK